MESEWSWFVVATVLGFFLQQRYRPEVLYSTGGSVRLYRWLEQRIASRCDAFVFLTSQAMENARQRAGCHFPGVVAYPGATMRRSGKAFGKDAVCRFAHFRSLAGSCNLEVFFAALHQFLLSHPEEG